MSMKELHPRLAEVFKRAEAIVGSVESKYFDGQVRTVEELLRSAQSIEEDRDRRLKINTVANEIQNFLRSSPASKREADTQVYVWDTQAYAYITMLPARPGGRASAFEDILANVSAAGIVHGVNLAILESAHEKVNKKGGIVYCLKFAECTLPEKGETGEIRLLGTPFDKAALFDAERPFDAQLPPLPATISAGQKVAEATAGKPGKPGKSVRGEEIPPAAAGGATFRPGPGLRQGPDGKSLYAAHSGVLVKAGRDVDVVPFYTIAGDLPVGSQLKFGGNVLVTGNVQGPCTIECEDLYAGGNVESVTLEAGGDVYAGGGIVGKRTGRVVANGSVFARFVSDAQVECMGDLVVRDSIAYSDATSNSRILVISKQGAIFGGTVRALKEISAQQIGSDFASYTTTIVGKDFLTGSVLGRIEGKIREYEEKLNKIDMLKRKLMEQEVQLSKLPPEQQDLYVGIFQKEAKAREELGSLRRMKEKSARALQDFLTASIKVAQELHPPVKVQICSAVQEITQRMSRVVLVLDRENRVFAMQEGP